MSACPGRTRILESNKDSSWGGYCTGFDLCRSHVRDLHNAGSWRIFPYDPVYQGTFRGTHYAVHVRNITAGSVFSRHAEYDPLPWRAGTRVWSLSLPVLEQNWRSKAVISCFRSSRGSRTVNGRTWSNAQNSVSPGQRPTGWRWGGPEGSSRGNVSRNYRRRIFPLRQSPVFWISPIQRCTGITHSGKPEKFWTYRIMTGPVMVCLRLEEYGKSRFSLSEKFWNSWKNPFWESIRFEDPVVSSSFFQIFCLSPWCELPENFSLSRVTKHSRFHFIDGRSQ